MQRTLCEEISKSRTNWHSNGFSVITSWIPLGTPQSYYLLYCKFKENISLQKRRDKKEYFYGSLANCFQPKLFFICFYKVGWGSGNHCNTEENNANIRR